MRYITAMCCAVALTALVAPAAHADEYNKLTYVTFSGAVQVPGATLPAGTYTFKLADPANSRRVIQIWNKDATHIYATLLTIPNQRFQPTDKPVILFKETAAGEPQAVQAWFYPGDRYGEEFVYPKDQALRIAKATHTPVLSTASTKSDATSLRSAEVSRVDEKGQSTKTEPVTVTAQNTAPAAPAPVPTSGVQARSELPRTASNLPLVALLSVLSLLAAFSLGLAREALTRG